MPSKIGISSKKFLRLFYKIIIFGSLFLLGIFGIANFSSQTQENLGFPDQISLNSVEYDSKFCVIYDYWKSDPEFRAGNHVTLILHSTPSYLEFLKKQTETWEGGISIAVFIPTPKIELGENGDLSLSSSQIHLQTIVAVIDSLKTLMETKKVSMHLFFDKKSLAQCPEIHLQKLPFLPTISDLTEFSSNPTEIYPINPARNIARIGSHTRLFISGDIEQYFVEKFESKILKLANRVLLEEKQAIVLVHRRFEIASDAPEPRCKEDLKKMLESKQAVPFHQFVYSFGHSISGLNEWLNAKNREEATIQKIISYSNSEWEPMFVGDQARIPFHDNRFPFRLRSNTHLGTLLCYQGFKFAIINDLFTYHRGIKRSESSKDSAMKQLSFKNGYRKMVDRFRNELHDKYPGMRDQCPLFLP